MNYTHDLYDVDWEKIFSPEILKGFVEFNRELNGYDLKKYSSEYIVSKRVQYEIPINIPEYNKDLDVIQVIGHGLMLYRTDFGVSKDGKSILVSKPFRRGTRIIILVYKAVEKC